MTDGQTYHYECEEHGVVEWEIVYPNAWAAAWDRDKETVCAICGRQMEAVSGAEDEGGV